MRWSLDQIDQTGFAIVEPMAPDEVLVAVGDVHRRIERRCVMERGEFDLDHAAPALADEVDAGVDDQAVQPMVERRRVA